MLTPSPFKLPSDSLPPPPPPVAFCESLVPLCLRGRAGLQLRLTGPLRMMSWVRAGGGEGRRALLRDQEVCKWDQGLSPQTQEASSVGRGRRRMGEDPRLRQAARPRTLPPTRPGGCPQAGPFCLGLSVPPPSQSWPGFERRGGGTQGPINSALTPPSLCACHRSSPRPTQAHLLPLWPLHSRTHLFTHSDVGQVRCYSPHCSPHLGLGQVTRSHQGNGIKAGSEN